MKLVAGLISAGLFMGAASTALADKPAWDIGDSRKLEELYPVGGAHSGPVAEGTTYRNCFAGLVQDRMKRAGLTIKVSTISQWLNTPNYYYWYYGTDLEGTQYQGYFHADVYNYLKWVNPEHPHQQKSFRCRMVKNNGFYRSKYFFTFESTDPREFIYTVEIDNSSKNVKGELGVYQQDEKKKQDDLDREIARIANLKAVEKRQKEAELESQQLQKEVEEQKRQLQKERDLLEKEERELRKGGH